MALETVLRSLKAAADPSRLRILRALGRGPFSVAELTEMLGLGQSTVSRHLRILTDAGLLTVRRAGTWAFYSLRATDGGNGGNGDFGASLLEWLDASRVADGDAVAVQRVLARRQSRTTQFFRESATSWDRIRDEALGPPLHLDRLVARAGDPDTAVDLGTGTGVLLERLAGCARRVIGIDASPEMLAVARERADRANLERVDLRLGALEHLPLSNGEADLMVANLVLHHVADLPSVLGEMLRGLAPGGRILVADLEEHDDERFWTAIGARWPGFRPEELAEQCESAGFTNARYERVRTASTNGNGNGQGSVRRPTVFLLEASRVG